MMQPSTAPMSYVSAGLRITSELEIPGLTPIEVHPDQRYDVTIRRANLPQSLPAAKVSNPDWDFDGRATLLRIPAAGRYLITADEIVIDEEAGCDPGDLRAYLLGTVFGVLCHQRGITPLHASSIDTPRGCVAFIGPSGAGKSTMVSALASRSHNVLSDDVCFLKLADNDLIQCWPGINRLRLWEDAMHSLGRDFAYAEREFRGYNKYLVSLAAPERPIEPRCLSRIYQLEPASEGEPSTIVRLTGAVALEAIISNVYRLTMAELMGHKPHLFKVCSKIAHQIPIFRFRRPKNYDALSGTIDAIEEHLDRHF